MQCAKKSNPADVLLLVVAIPISWKFISLSESAPSLYANGLAYVETEKIGCGYQKEPPVTRTRDNFMK